MTYYTHMHSYNQPPYKNVPSSYPRRFIDTHEIQKREIFQQGTAAPQQPIIDSYPGAAPLPPPPMPTQSIGVDDIYLNFDSLARENTGSLANGELRWSINTLNRNQPINNCIQIQTSDFYFPLILNAATAPEFYFYRQVYLHISSLPTTQGVLAVNNTQYHFAFDVASTNSIAVRLIPRDPIFHFRQPITDLSQFNLRFMVPLQTGAGLAPIPIHSDKVIVEAVPGSNPARFTILDNTISPLIDLATLPNTFPAAPYTPALPVAVVITGFVSTDPNLNMAVGSTAGVFVDNFINFNVFSVSTLSFAGLATPIQATVIINKNRVQMAMRFSSLNTSSSNYIPPLHN